MHCDLTMPPTLGETFDLAVCLETAEHLEERCADSLLSFLTTTAPLILFSAAIPGKGGKNHKNEQYPSYWVSRFLARGFAVADVIRPVTWHDSRLFPWFRQNLLLFYSTSHLDLSKHFASCLLPSFSGIDCIHPHYYDRTLKKISSLKAQLRHITPVKRGLKSVHAQRFFSKFRRFLYRAGAFHKLSDNP
jgi:hypothetical protein